MPEVPDIRQPGTDFFEHLDGISGTELSSTSMRVVPWPDQRQGDDGCDP